MKKLIFIAIFTILFTSCADSGNDLPNFHYEIIPIEEATIPSSFELDETYDITIKYDLPNGCYSFHSLYYKHEDTKRVVAVYALVLDDVVCTEAIISEEYTFEVKASQEEDYTFKLWKGVDDDDEDIFDEVIVPVTGTSNN